MRFPRHVACSIAVLALVDANAATYVVNSAVDPGSGGCTVAECTLREAIVAANATGIADDVAFAIPGAGPHTIAIGSNLPSITSPLDIDGYTQAGASPNTLAMGEGGSDAIILVAVEGVDCASCTGLRFTTGPGSVRGLAMTGFPIASIARSDTGAGVLVVAGNFFNYGTDGLAPEAEPNRVLFANGALRFGGTAPADRNLVGFFDFAVAASHSNTVVAGNLFGMDRNGTPHLCRRPGFQSTAVLLSEPRIAAGSTPIVGGDTVAHRNVFAACEAVPIEIDCDPTCWDEVRVQGNFIGVDLDGAPPQASGASLGVNILVRPGPAGRVLVGGDGIGEANVLAVDAFAAVSVAPVRLYAEYGAVSVWRNRFVGMEPGEHPIRFRAAGAQPTPPPDDAGDADSGPNRLQNRPVVQAFDWDEASVTITYVVDSATAHSAYPLRIDFIQSDGRVASGRVSTDLYEAAHAQQPRTVVIPRPAGEVLPFWVTATDGAGRTSPVDTTTLGGAIFGDGFE